MARLARLLTADELSEMWKTVGALDACWGEPELADGLGDVLHTAETLRGALARYGRHERDCAWRQGPGRCTCGLWDALGLAHDAGVR